MPCVFLSFTIIKLPVRILLSRKEAHTLCSFSSSSKERNSSERFLPSIVLTSITETYYGLGSRRCPTLKMVLSCLLHFCLSRPFPTFLPQRFSLYIIAFWISFSFRAFPRCAYYISSLSSRHPLFTFEKKILHFSEILIRSNGKRRMRGGKKGREMKEKWRNVRRRWLAANRKTGRKSLEACAKLIVGSAAVRDGEGLKALLSNFTSVSCTSR